MNPSTKSNREPLDNYQSSVWTVWGVVGAWIIGAADDSLASALLWSTGSIVFGDAIFPALESYACRVSERYRWDLLDVVFGWGLVPGPLIGSCVGVLTPLLWELPITSFQGGLIGLIVGPIFAAVEGLVIVSLVLFIYWMVTGRMMPGMRLWPGNRSS